MKNEKERVPCGNAYDNERGKQLSNPINNWLYIYIHINIYISVYVYLKSLKTIDIWYICNKYYLNIVTIVYDFNTTC